MEFFVNDSASSNTNTTLPPQGVDLYAFVSSTAINIVVGVTLFSIFCGLRLTARCYTSRFLIDPSGFPPFPKGFFSWIKPLIGVEEEVVFTNSGLDALIYVKFFARLFKLFLCGSVIGLLLLIVNVYGKGEQFGFGAIAVSNVAEGSHLLVCHLVSVYAFTFICFYFLRNGYREYAKLRHRHLAEYQPVTARSVLVSCLPSSCTTQAELEAYFSKLYSSQFQSAAIANWSAERAKLFEQRKKALVKLEEALASFAEKGERPRHKAKGCCAFNLPTFSSNKEAQRLDNEGEASEEKVDSIEYWTHRIRIYNEEIEKSELPKTANAGFVTFRTLRAAHEATRMLLDGEPFCFKCRLAPEVRDVCWQNLGMKHGTQKIRELFGTLMVVGLILVSTIPITAIAAVTTLPNLVKYLPTAVGDVLLDSPILSGFLSGFLPSLANIIFLALLPTILTSISSFEGLQSFNWIERRMARYFFTFAVFTFFIAQTLASSLLAAISQIKTVGDVIDLLAVSVPKFGYFFSIFILMQALVTLPLALVDPGTLILSAIAKKFAKTERAVRDAEKPAPIWYGVEYPNHLLVFVIAVSYAIIQPIILVFASIYFGIAYIVAKYRVLFVAVPKYESGGQFWPDLFTHMCIGLLVAQLTLIGVFGLKQVPVEAGFLLPLPFITLAFWIYVRSEFKLLSESLPLAQMSEDQPIEAPSSSMYVAPEMDTTPLTPPAVEDTRIVHAEGFTYYAFGPAEEQKSQVLSNSM